MRLNEQLSQLTQERFGLQPRQCDGRQLYEALLLLTRRAAQNRPAPAGERKLYYFSAEFLMGRLLSNNLLALGLYGEAKELLADLGRDLGALESLEPEPSLGNGGLGRLAACFLDSIAALGLPGDGVGLNYHYGLFKQKFEEGRQTESPDPWIQPESWLIPTGKRFTVPFGGFDLEAALYDIAVPGAGSGCANRLHLFDVTQPAPPPQEGISFDKGDIAHCLTAFLYPDDSDDAGRLLRVYQQYFMVSAGAQLILQELEERGYAPETLADHVVIQINDTHPSMVIPELTAPWTRCGGPAPIPTTPSWRRPWRSGPWPSSRRRPRGWSPSSGSWTAGTRRSTPTRPRPSSTGRTGSTWPTWTFTTASPSTAWRPSTRRF